MTPSLRSALLWTGGTSMALVAAIGVLHLPFAAPLMARMSALCPVDSVPRAQVERMQRAAMATRHCGYTASDALPKALPVVLRTLTAGQPAVDAWVSGGGRRCSSTTRGFSYVTCRDVPASMLGRDGADVAREREVVFAFDTAHTLVGIDVLARTSPGQEAAAVALQAEQDLVRALGTPQASVGTLDAASLSTPYASATRRFEFTDAVVVLTATVVPGSGAIVREQYLRMGTLD